MDGKEVNGERGESADATAISKTQADMIYHLILDLKDAGHLAKRQLNLDLVATNLVNRYEIDTEEYAKDLISARAGIILELMDEAKTSNFDWSRKAIYRELKVASSDDTDHVALTPLRPRSENEESSEESDHEEQPKPRRRRVRKSVLRPKMSSKSAKQTGKRTRPEEDEDEEDEEMAEDYETPSKVRGHELVRDPLSTKAKRTRSILSDSESTSVQKTPLQETLQSRNTSVSVVEPEPSELNGSHIDNFPYDNFPPDTWVCQAQDCGKVVYKSSSKRGKDMIQDHSLAHADDTQAKLDLVFSEQRLNINLPVDNLLGRIREMGSFNPELPNLANGMSSVT